MRRTAWILAGVLILAGMGCSSMAINNDYDTNADFRSYKTFDWLDNRPGIGENVRARIQEHQLFDKWLRTAVAAEFGAKGLERDEVDPDLLVIYHVGAGGEIDVTDWGYRYGIAYFGGYSRDIDVYAYREGTLVLDLIDAKTMDLIWRGSAQNTIDEKPTDEKPTPEQIEQKIGEAVKTMLGYYPPV